MNVSWLLITFFFTLKKCTQIDASIKIAIDYANSSYDVKAFPRFWTNIGFSPLQESSEFLQSSDVNLNLEIIGSLPNKGLRNVRIHWLLNFLDIIGYDNHTPIYNFKDLDDFLWKLIKEYKLLPTIEFMVTKKPKNVNKLVWQNLAYQVTSKYIGFYGVKNIVNKWKFETWNEPDLKMYNTLNFTLIDYLDYVNGISDGLRATERQYSLGRELKLRGPAGLFKDVRHHPFCWSLLENCNNNLSTCPIDVITFHRKGNGDGAENIIEETSSLLKEFSEKFPNLLHMKYSNSESDPIKKWSEPRDFQADTRYAGIVIATVFQYWSKIFEGNMTNLESISHDNGFLNFYPHIFTQRTLLARIQMNNTLPKHTQFISKPVFSALGLMAYSGPFATNVFTSENFSYLITRNNASEIFYSCILIASHVDSKHFNNKTKTYEVEVKNIPEVDDLWYFVEGIDNKRTNPAKVYENYGKPAFPEFKVLEALRKSQHPIILEQPTKVVDGKIFLNAQLMEPFALAIRICSRNISMPKKVNNLRIRKVNSQEIILFWSDALYRSRCIATYEIFFRYQNNDSYIQIETNSHIPFLFYQLKHTIPGCFKIRSKDIFNRYSEFSQKICYET